MHTPNLMRQAQARAAERMDEAKRSYLERAVPKLDEGQCAWICQQAVLDPRFFDTMVQKFGTEQMRGYLERYAGTMSQLPNEPMSQINAVDQSSPAAEG